MTQFTRVLLLAFVAFVLTGGVIAYTIQEKPEDILPVLKPVRDVVVSVAPSLAVEETVEVASMPVETQKEEASKEGDIAEIELLIQKGEMVRVIVIVEGDMKEVLSLLEETEFELGRTFEVTSGFVGNIGEVSFKVLMETDTVRSISIDRAVGIN